MPVWWNATSEVRLLRGCSTRFIPGLILKDKVSTVVDDMIAQI